MTISRQALLGIALGINLAVAAGGAPAQHRTAYDYSLVSLNGKEVSLSTYKGKVILIVNLASQSVYMHQIEALDKLQKDYADKGLVVVGIPSGDFGAQELADNAAIQHYYLDSQHVTFQIFSKTSLRGKDSIPLAHFLTDPKDGTGGGDIHWNFTKFVVNRKGEPVLRCEADSDPADPQFRALLEQILDGTYKKKASPAKDSNTPAEGDDDDGGV
jgi:glutathione peroxidase